MEENIEKHINKINHMATADFEGLSPIEMDNLLYNTFEKGSPVQLRKLNDEDYASIPILNQMLYFAHHSKSRRNKTDCQRIFTH